jgi:hypothetical protein
MCRQTKTEPRAWTLTIWPPASLPVNGALWHGRSRWWKVDAPITEPML